MNGLTCPACKKVFPAEVQGRFLYSIIVSATEHPEAPPGLLLFGQMPDGHDIHAHILRQQPSAKKTAAMLMRLWLDVPPALVASLESDARKNVRSGIHRAADGVASTLYVDKNPLYPAADYAAPSAS